MVNSLATLSTIIRSFGERFFRAFGIHCATHQIRVILICCVVITSLLYPALALYSTTQSQYLSRLRILTSFSQDHQRLGTADLVELWTGHDAVTQTTSASQYCGLEKTWRVERILIHNAREDDDDVLRNDILLSALQLEHAIQEELGKNELPCSVGEKCLSLSPLAFWNHDAEALLKETNIQHTLSSQPNITYAGITLAPAMVFAGREAEDVSDPHFDRAKRLSLTFFIDEKLCADNTKHNLWLGAVMSSLNQVSTLSHESSSSVPEPTLISLQFTAKDFNFISLLTYSIYIIGLAYSTWSIRRMEASMHSPIGLSVTGLVEIIASTFTSLSVCALAGFKVTLVPWEFLPMILFFVGVENMMSLTEAVIKTPVTLPVKQRLAEGLSKAGTSNTLKLISYNTVLGVIAGFSTGAIQQFCAFAIVVLVAHWFLAHVFFVTVLSIDMQRLELEDLIRQDPSSAPTVSPTRDKKTAKAKSLPQKIWLKLQALLQGRASKNLSLVLLLAVTAVLYYTTYPAIDPLHAGHVPAPRRAERTNSTHPHISAQPWNILNPERNDHLHLLIHPPTLLSFQPDEQIEKPYERRSGPILLSSNAIRAAYNLSKIILLPITATTGLLYLLLLYLLKDAELLEAQRNRAEEDSDTTPQKESLASLYTFSTIPRGTMTDTELIAVNQDGRVIVSTSVQGEISIWQKSVRAYERLDTSDLTSTLSSGSSAGYLITAVAVDLAGDFVAFGTRCGLVAAWSLGTTDGSASSILKEQLQPSPVTELTFIGSNRSATLVLVASQKSGYASRWQVQKSSFSHEPVIPRSNVLISGSTLLRLGAGGSYVVAFLFADGTFSLEKLDPSEGILLFDQPFGAGKPYDPVTQLHACKTYLEGGERIVIVAATESGVISLWDGQSGETITFLEESYGKVSNLRVSHIFCEACHFCGELPLESFSLAFSVDSVVVFYKAYMQSQTRRCTCSHNQPRPSVVREPSGGRRSRSGSVTNSPLLGPVRLRTPNLDSTSLFPVSGHGVHSRRASENGNLRSSVSLSLPIPTIEFLDGMPPPVYEAGRASAGPAVLPSSSFWRNLIMRKELETSCGRGGWASMGDTKLVGLRRRLRMGNGSGSGGGGGSGIAGSSSSLLVPSGVNAGHSLSSAALVRWEVWLYDPSSVSLQQSTLASLCSPPETDEGSRPPSRRTSLSSLKAAKERDAHVPRLPFTRASPVVSGNKIYVGFGNTIGIIESAVL